MAATFGSIFVIAALGLVPFTFLFAGKDTDRKRPSGRERQREALMDWTDKDRLAEQERAQETAGIKPAVRSCVRVERIARETAVTSAA